MARKRRNPPTGRHIADFGDQMAEGLLTLHDAEAAFHEKKYREAYILATRAEHAAAYAILQLRYLEPHAGEEVVVDGITYRVPTDPEHARVAHAEAVQIMEKAAGIRIASMCETQRDLPSGTEPRLRLVRNPVRDELLT